MPGIRSVAIINDSESGAAMKSLSEAGFDDFIVKPLRVQNVNETVQRVMLDIS
jgi:FixJ family two-component response regulator